MYDTSSVNKMEENPNIAMSIGLELGELSLLSFCNQTAKALSSQMPLVCLAKIHRLSPIPSFEEILS